MTLWLALDMRARVLGRDMDAVRQKLRSVFAVEGDDRSLDWQDSQAVVAAWIDIESGNLVLIEGVGPQLEPGVLLARIYVEASNLVVPLESRPQRYTDPQRWREEQKGLPTFDEAFEAAIAGVRNHLGLPEPAGR